MRFPRHRDIDTEPGTFEPWWWDEDGGAFPPGAEGRNVATSARGVR